MGSIKRVHRGYEGQEQNADVTLDECSHVDVLYVLTGNVEKMIPLTRLTAVPIPWKVPTFTLNCVGLKSNQCCNSERNRRQREAFD